MFLRGLGTRSQLFSTVRRRVRRSSSFWPLDSPGQTGDRRKLGRGASSRWCTRGAVTVIMPSDHPPSSVSNRARLSERGAKVGWPLHCPQNARGAATKDDERSPETPQHPRQRATPRRPAISFTRKTSHPARPLADERYLVVRKAALEDAHDLPAMRQGLLPPAEEGVRLVRLPGRQDAPV